jgi:hypothetical protein
MLAPRNRYLLALATALTGVAVVTGDGRAYAAGQSTSEVECSPCENGNGTHNWEPSCCFGTSDCYMYPDATLYGNGGSCQGMHRPCDAAS